jgi:hypothetical protein
VKKHVTCGILIWALLAASASAQMIAQKTSVGTQIAARHTVVMTSPPAHVPDGKIADGPTLGNGDLGLVLGGTPQQQRFHIGKNDFWNQQCVVLSVGGYQLDIPALAGGTWRQEQDMANAEVRGTFTKGGLTLRMRTWTQATENLAVTELTADGGSPAVTLSLFPDQTKLIDNNKIVNIGREQTGNGRWYFEGLIDEVLIYKRALEAGEIKQLAHPPEGAQDFPGVNVKWEIKRQPDTVMVKNGLLRRWGFDEEQGTDEINATARLVMGGTLNEDMTLINRAVETPENYPTRAALNGYYHDYQRMALGRFGRAPKFTHEYMYVEAPAVPPVEHLTLSAWVFVYEAGDFNYILTKGAFNEAYSLGLDHGRLRFNVGERFVRSVKTVPTNQWVHVAGSYDGQRLRAYVDGEEVLPRARYLYGQTSDDTIWFTRNADGPLDQMEERPQPLAPTYQPGLELRKVAVATRVIGAASKADGDSIAFTLQPGQTVRLVTNVQSDLDAGDTIVAARKRVVELTPDSIVALNAAHRAWWNQFWSESFIDIDDDLLEKFYYSSNYLMGSASRSGKTPPGLYGPWVTTDHPAWNGDYTLNYNHQTPYLGLWSSNHIACSDSYDQPILDFMARGEEYARVLLNARGVYYPGHIGPWGMEHIFDYDPMMGEKSDAAFCAMPMLDRFYDTYDDAYARRVYPFIHEVSDFWEDVLVMKEGKYQVIGDTSGEVGPWRNDLVNWRAGYDSNNTPRTLFFIRSVFQGLIDISTELGTDANLRPEWKHYLDNLYVPPANTGRRGGGGNAAGAGNGSGPGGQWPAPISGNGEAILTSLRQMVSQNALPNGYIYTGGGGVEVFCRVPRTINDMLLRTDDGVLRLFPFWPRTMDARFGDLRAKGAFLVSSRLVSGQIAAVTIRSEKGRLCVLENPWPGTPVTLYRSGKKAEELTGPRIEFPTAAGESISLLGPGKPLPPQ